MNKKIILTIIVGLVLIGLLVMLAILSRKPEVSKSNNQTKKEILKTEQKEEPVQEVITETNIQTDIQVVPDDILIDVLPTDTTDLNKQTDINTMENLPEANAFKKAETNPFEEGYENPFE
jgi:hypothetical protein